MQAPKENTASCCKILKARADSHPQLESQMRSSLGFTTTCSKQHSATVWGSDRCSDWLKSDVRSFYPSHSHGRHHSFQSEVFNETRRSLAFILHLSSRGGRALARAVCLSAFLHRNHIFAAFCSAANVATQKHQNITTVDPPGIRLKYKLVWALILHSIPIAYPFMALGCQYLIILLKQASIFF